MEVLTVREYRNNLSRSFDRANKGEQVVIRRNRDLYTLTYLGKEDVMLTPQMQEKIDRVVTGFSKSLEEVRLMEAGIMPTQSAREFLDEL